MTNYYHQIKAWYNYRQQLLKEHKLPVFLFLTQPLIQQWSIRMPELSIGGNYSLMLFLKISQDYKFAEEHLDLVRLDKTAIRQPKIIKKLLPSLIFVGRNNYIEFPQWLQQSRTIYYTT